MFDFITYFTDCVPDYIKKPLSFVLFCSGIGSFTDGCGSEAGGTASCGISVVGGTTAFLRTSRWKRAFSLFSRPRNHIR